MIIQERKAKLKKKAVKIVKLSKSSMKTQIQKQKTDQKETA